MDPMQHAWILEWDIHELARNPFNLFNANIHFPNRYTLAYSEHQVVTALIASPIIAATNNPILGINFMVMFNLFMASLGAYFLVRHLTGNRFAGVVAGVAYAYAPYKIAHLTHLNLLSAEWIPFAILFLHLYCEEGKTRDVGLFGLFFVLQTLSAWHYGLFLGIGVAIFLALRLLFFWRTFTLRWVLKLAVVLVMAVLIIYPFARPYLKLDAEAQGFGRSLDEVDFYSADVQDFLLAPRESFVWGKLTARFRQDAIIRGGEVERVLFPGLVPLVLGIAGAVVLIRWRRRNKEYPFVFWFYVSVAVISGIFCLGPVLHIFGHRTNISLPYKFLYYVVPGFKGMRTPARFDIMIALSLAVFSGFAVKALMEWVHEKDRALLPGAVSVLILAVLIIDLMPVSLPMYRVPLKKDFPRVYTWLKEQKGDAPTTELPLPKYTKGEPDSLDTGMWLALEPSRIYYSTLHWKKILNGYSGFLPRSYIEAARMTMEFPSKKGLEYLRKLGIKYIIVHEKEMEPGSIERINAWARDYGGISLVKQFDSDYVYELTGSKAPAGP
jgi:hypothetical protein